VAIGTPTNIVNGSYSGRVKVYEDVGGVWTQIGADIEGEEDDILGAAVSLSFDGSRVAIGATGFIANVDDPGHVRIYEEIGGVWTQIGTDIDGEGGADDSGKFVSISFDGSIVAIGADKNDGNGEDSGHVRIYEEVGGVWTQIGMDIDGETAGDESGVAVSLSSDGGRVSIGASLNDGNGNASGHVRVFDLSSLIVSIENVDQVSPLNIFPNPVTDKFILEVPEEITNNFIFSIKNIIGKEVFQKSYRNTDPIELDISDFSTGVYLVKVVSGDDKWVEKIIKE